MAGNKNIIKASQKHSEALYFGVASMVTGILFIFLTKQGWIWIEVDTMAALMKSYYAYAVQSTSIISAICALYYADSGLIRIRGNGALRLELPDVAGALLGLITIGIPFYFPIFGFQYILFTPCLVFCFGIWLGSRCKDDLRLKNPCLVLGIIITAVGIISMMASWHVFLTLGLTEGE